ncbi:MAG: GNAT family N-acetyltransferase [Defluviitaleaceae bacterium]|nr:GNAT family N-acetyltransferase [Defluviitaleaceae bacterium]
MKKRILYSMCYDMLEQNHIAFKTEAGLAIYCEGMPLWIMPLQGLSSTDARLFFEEFLQNFSGELTDELIGIVAEKDIALACVGDKKFSDKEIIAYYLEKEVFCNVSGELRAATASDSGLALGWISDFYAETLHAVLPQSTARKGISKASNVKLFLWWDNCPVAMGMISETGETCRMNLIYTAPNFRGRGYGRALVSALARRAFEASKVPMLYADSANFKAVGLYNSLGFREAGRLLELTF